MLIPFKITNINVTRNNIKVGYLTMQEPTQFTTYSKNITCSFFYYASPFSKEITSSCGV